MNREWEKANALAAIAEAEDRLRNRTRARSLKHRIWSKYPTTDEADAIWADISTGRLSWPGAETYIERLEGLIAAGHITSAKALVAAFGARGGTFGSGAKPDPNVAWRDYGLGEIALSDRDYDGARALFEGALAVAETSRLKARLRCRVGKSIARKGELDEAKGRLRVVAEAVAPRTFRSAVLARLRHAAGVSQRIRRGAQRFHERRGSVCRRHEPASASRIAVAVWPGSPTAPDTREKR